MSGAEVERSSYRRILSSTSIIGGATLITIVIGILRTKILAVLGGPEGIGLLGVLTNVTGIVTTLAGLGLATSAVRDLAAAEEPARKAEIRRALWLGTIPLAILGAALLWLFREPIARLATDRGEHALLIGLSGIAVLLGVLGASQQAILQGLQRIRALGIVRIAGAVGATLLAVPAVWLLGAPGMVVAVIAVPLATLGAALFFRTPELPRAAPRPLAKVARDLRGMAALGAVMTVTGVVQLASLGFVRTLVVQEGSLAEAGLFQAVVAITSMNIALVLGAMSADFFPRLSAAKDRAQGNEIVNTQLHVALLLAAPLIIAMVAGAPLVLSLLYSSQFSGAETMLRWQLIGDMLKIPGWAVGFVLLAKGDRKAYLFVELLFALALAGGAVLLVPRLGLEGAGIAYLLAYVAYAGALAAICGVRHGTVIRRENAAMLGIALAILVALKLLADRSEMLSLGAGAVLAAGFGLFALRELGGRTGLIGRRGAA